MEKESPKLILASQSPRRKQLLAQIGLQAEVYVADIDERILPGEPAEDYVRRLALAKARKVQSMLVSAAEDHDYRWILGSDTTVAMGSDILAKPEDKGHALAMWRKLSGQTHQVLSSVCLLNANTCEYQLAVSTNQVRFKTLSEQAMLEYWQTGEPCDKAGGYAIQGKAALWIEHIEGSFSAIMGLPLYETASLLDQAGFVLEAW